MDEENGESLHLFRFLEGPLTITCKSSQLNFIFFRFEGLIEMNYDQKETEIRNYNIALETVYLTTEGQTNIPWDLVP